jgi:beta-glucosidase
MGYRWYDHQGIDPLFPFGFGLSYTQFSYLNLVIRPDNQGVELSFLVENSGSTKGREVPQVYVGPPSRVSLVLPHVTSVLTDASTWGANKAQRLSNPEGGAPTRNSSRSRRF